MGDDQIGKICAELFGVPAQAYSTASQSAFRVEDFNRLMREMNHLRLVEKDQQRLITEWCVSQRALAEAAGFRKGWIAAGGDPAEVGRTDER